MAGSPAVSIPRTSQDSSQHKDNIGSPAYNLSDIPRNGLFNNHLFGPHVVLSAHAASLSVWNHGGAGLIAVAAFLFSCSSLCVKLITLQSHPMPTFEIMMAPSLFCLFCTTILLHNHGEAFVPGVIFSRIWGQVKLRERLHIHIIA